MLTPKEGEEAASLNGILTLPAIYCYFVLPVFITESLIELYTSSLRRKRIFLGQKHGGFYQSEMILNDQKHKGTVNC